MSRTRPRRAAAATPPPSRPETSTPTRSRLRRGNVEEPPAPPPASDDEDAIGEDEEEEEEAAPVSKSVKRKRGRPQGSQNRRKSGVAHAMALESAGDTEVEGDDGAAPRRRVRKSVSYREIPVETIDDPEEDEDDEEEEEEVAAPPPPTPRKRGRPPINRPAEDGDDDKDRSYGREKIPGGSGRGGFSVKGAASAAARARWDRVRRERAERGEEDTPRVKRQPAASAASKRSIGGDYAMGTTITIKGEEYNVGDDELNLPDDPKGEAKVDASGRLLGGREYKPIVFTSKERRNPERVYALTIDAARACGYSDSLAFLRKYPTILKLSCTMGEREMLIDLGRITGNLKHRQVTMVSMHNVYKVMGAKMVKNGRWVTDDYYEDAAAARCTEEGIEPGSIIQDEEIAPPAATPAAVRQGLGESSRSIASLSTFYTVSGPTTHFAGNGVDPWSDAGFGNRRARLRGAGVTEEDWMLRMAEESRAVDEQLREWRGERLVELEGVDATRGWVYALESGKDGEERELEGEEADAEGEDEEMEVDVVAEAPLKPGVERKPSGLSHEVTMEDVQEQEATQAQGEGEDSAEVQAAPQPKGPAVIVEEPGAVSSQYNWGIGKSWQPGVVRAAFEPHTHMPHVPQRTQPTASQTAQLSPYPIISSASDPIHLNFAQSSITGRAARGLASLEYVLETEGGGEAERRAKEVEDAVRWEREMRARKGVQV
ncbi:hypothetical protein IAT38_002932 [Cryptococcus sp. DSM 104549]